MFLVACGLGKRKGTLASWSQMVHDRQDADDQRSERIDQNDSRHHVLELPDDGIVIRFDFIEKIFDERVEDFRPEDEEDRDDDQGHFEQTEIKNDRRQQRDECPTEVKTEIAFLFPNETDAANGVTGALDKLAGHAKMIHCSHVGNDCVAALVALDLRRFPRSPHDRGLPAFPRERFRRVG